MNEKQTYDVFLSYNSLDRPAVLHVAEALEERGCSCFLDQWYLKPGRNWVESLEQALAVSHSAAVFIGPSEMGRWQQKERAWLLDRQASEGRFAVVPVLLPGCEPPLGFLGQLMWIDLRPSPTSAEQLDALAAAIRGEDGTSIQRKETRASICPYRGLLSFREEDAAFFFGREKYTEDLLGKVERHRLVAVVGASGSGKSSVVRAGLIPRLRARKEPVVWEIATMVPGEEPLKHLVLAMAPMLWPDITDAVDLREKANEKARSLSEGNLGLTDLVEIALENQKGSQRILMLVDQWEELYTQCKDPEDTERFIEQLLHATASDRSPLSVVLTVRGDFYNKLLQNRPLMDALQDSKLDLPPMNRDELRSAIEQPATAVGLILQDGLVDRLLDDAREEPGGLPLLEFALEELWKRQAAGELTHAAYQDLGRLSGAIAKRAEDIYGQLDRVEQEVMPELFRRLVRAGAKAEEDTRRRADLGSLDATSQRVVQKLADRDARLLVTSGRDSTAGESRQPNMVLDDSRSEVMGVTVEVAHEALFRSWERLKNWINEDRQFLQWRLRLERDLDQYRNDRSALLRGVALREAKEFYHKRKQDLSQAENDFIRKSRNLHVLRKGGLWSVVVLAIAVFWGYREWNTARRSVELFVSTSPELFESHFKDLQHYQGRWPWLVDGWLQSKWDEADRPDGKGTGRTFEPQQRRHILFALARFGPVNEKWHQTLRVEADKVPPAERGNYVRTLKVLPSMDDNDWLVWTREADSPTVRRLFSSAAMSRGILGPAEWMARLTEDPVNRTELIHELLTDFRLDVQDLLAVLRRSEDDSLLSAICCALGREADNFSPDEKARVIAALQIIHGTSPGGGAHSASGWALRKLGETPVVPIADGAKEHRASNWCVRKVDDVELTFVLIPSIDVVERTAHVADELADKGTGPESDSSPRFEMTSDLWVSDREVSRQLFEMFRDDETFDRPRPTGWKLSDDGERASPTGAHPVCEVSWHEAAAFCNWLSWKTGIKEDQWCYEIGSDEQNVVAAVNMDWKKRAGYRLLTSDEWEHACRSGSMAEYCFGNDRSKLVEYAVYGREWQRDSAEPCGEKLPNGRGLFDMHGNVWEWCHDDLKMSFGSSRGRRGGSWDDSAGNARSAARGSDEPTFRFDDLGFRLALSRLGEDAERPER